MDTGVLKRHIMGCLANSFIGDSMGSATESIGPEEIRKRYGGMVTTFQNPTEGTFAAGRQAGQLTDDTTQMLEVLWAIVEGQGTLTVDAVASHLLKWAENEELFKRFAGPTTRRAIQLLREGMSPHNTGRPAHPLDMGVSNGAAMKVAPVGLAHPGDLDAAVQNATVMCIPTHYTDLAFAGAGATAAAVAEAIMSKANLLSVVDAALYGAKKGYEIGKEHGVHVSCPSIADRIRLAVEIAAPENDFERACLRLRDVIGCGLPILEAVPLALGLFIAARGDPNRAVIGAVNLGGDADTTAAITGALAGAFAGIDAVDQKLYRTIEEVNKIDIGAIADRLVNLS